MTVVDAVNVEQETSDEEGARWRFFIPVLDLFDIDGFVVVDGWRYRW